ncbi:hypothetical protein GCM10010869_62340 [Mesorhizobium tianshanense]|uniref:hypothetical protein n=1 Tax=Mesorhizobium tianshanense TaxID=39844 RepID=UPI0011A19B54|nr:hypothetical protein [Mesorhizobium tianshanense]GLS40637.1 hypothetical protein GCM10010869_62340 [Mesorhizobium tianshanense]
MSNELTTGLLSGLGGAADDLDASPLGSQKIAEARTHWNELHRKLSVELNAVFSRMAGSGNARRTCRSSADATRQVLKFPSASPKARQPSF